MPFTTLIQQLTSAFSTAFPIIFIAVLTTIYLLHQDRSEERVKRRWEEVGATWFEVCTFDVLFGVGYLSNGGSYSLSSVFW